MRGLTLGGVLSMLVLLAGGAQAAETVVDVQLLDEGCSPPSEFCIRPSTIEVAEGDDLVLRVVNDGRVQHNLTFAPGTPEVLAEEGMRFVLEPGATFTLQLTWDDLEQALGEETFTEFGLRCGVTGHAALGMVATLAVGERPDPAQRREPFVGPLALLAVLVLAAAVRRR